MFCRLSRHQSDFSDQSDLVSYLVGNQKKSEYMFDPVPTQRVPPLVLFKKYNFGGPNLKFFERRLWRQYILILRGKRAPKKRIFLVTIFQKVPKNIKTPVLTVFSKICLHSCSSDMKKVSKMVRFLI